MRLRSVTYALNPGSSPGLLALRRQLANRGATAPPEVLGPVGALSELQAICGGMLTGRGGPNAGNRPSLTKDLSVALGSLGPEVRTAAAPTLTDFQRELPRLARRLDRPQGARVLALTLRPLLERLATPDVVRAAWRDVVATFLDTAEGAEQCELRLRQLVELAEHTGVDWERRRVTLEYVLSDDARVLAQIGALDRQPGGDPEFGRVDEACRITLCEERIAEPEARSSTAVWFVIDDAALERGYLAVGPVQLFDAGLWPDGARPGGVLERSLDDFQPPPELFAWDEAAPWFTSLPEADHRIFARVWVTDAPVAEARQRARAVLQAMIDLAKSDSAWVVLEGTASWREVGGWSGSSFMHPSEVEAARGPVHPVFERTARGLEEFRPDFVERLLRDDPVAVEAIDDALWTVSVERAAGAPQRIVLAIRALERTLSRAREQAEESWTEAAKRYLRAPWVEYALRNELLDAGISAIDGLPRRNAEDQALYEEVHDVVWPVTGPGERIFEVVGLAKCAARVLAALPDGSMEQRLVREADAVLTLAEVARVRISELGTRFDRLLARLERQRNALVHGTGTVHPVLSTVDDFAVVLARYVAQEAMRQAETGKEPLIELERERVRALEVDAQLEAGAAPLDVLFRD